jgi:hypothetical protein
MEDEVGGGLGFARARCGGGWRWPGVAGGGGGWWGGSWLLVVVVLEVEEEEEGRYVVEDEGRRVE